jgi:hypothetical protein
MDAAVLTEELVWWLRNDVRRGANLQQHAAKIKGQLDLSSQFQRINARDFSGICAESTV